MPWAPSFSHLYVEKEALGYPLAKAIMERFPNSELVQISDYKEVFNRPKQNFEQQKKSSQLILAVKKDHFLYDGSRFVQDHDNPNFHYNALSLNCVYDCSYCYLQGMYGSANQVCFVNLDDFFAATTEAIVQRRKPEHPLYLCISYDTDLLAFESVAPYSRKWIEYCTGREGDLLFEIRTKSANFSALADLKPQSGVILAWSISPETVCRQYEHRAPGQNARIKAMSAAVQAGWQVRLCIDPILPVNEWKDAYRELVDSVFNEIEPGSLLDAHIGVFRMNTGFFRNIRKRRQPVDLYYRPWQRANDTVTHSQEERANLTGFVRNLLSTKLPEGCIRTW